MKKSYVNPELGVIKMAPEDVLLLSSDVEDPYNVTNGEWFL